MKTILQSVSLCVVCDQKATGYHFGAVTCRACAVFFRRSWNWKKVKKCKGEDEKCGLTLKGLLSCKKCRLRKCIDGGMSLESYKLDEDLVVTARRSIQKQEIIPSLDTLLGQSSLICINTLFVDHSEPRVSHFVDFRDLIEKAERIMRRGPESPLFSKTSLGKLALGLNCVQKSLPGPDYRAVKKMGKEDTLAHWENDFLKVICWFTYSESFHRLPQCLKMRIAKTIWKIWNYIETLAKSARMIQSWFGEEMLKKMERDTVLYDWSHLEIDMSWCSRYSIQELQFFIDFPTQWKLDDETRLMIDLNPSDVELSYMLTQACFYYVGKKFPGEIQETVEKLQSDLADDLHKYYVEELKKPNYAGRVAGMMKINNMVQQRMINNQSKRELGKIFKVIDLELSNPEMFMDIC